MPAPYRTWQTLRELRLERRLTVAALARAADLPAPYVSQIETGDRIPTTEQTVRLAQALELPLERVRVVTQLVLVADVA
jgi:transcriptional regulator with XRE-family HTH domain